MIKLILLLILAVILLFALYVGGNILYATLTDFQPEAKVELEVNHPSAQVPNDSVFTFFIWNLGYGGLGYHADFFYDGGKTAISEKQHVEEYLDGIYKTIGEFGQTDFILLQEVDKSSRRSYYHDEVSAIGNILKDHSYAFALNYSVHFVPMPLTVPPWKAMGKVESGLATYAKFKSEQATRYQFPGNYSWPSRIYFLDRCFLLERFRLPNSKDLVVINTHNSAYDDGTLKAKQMEFLKGILLEEYNKGNYVIVGGDWNQCPPNFDYQHFGKDEDNSYNQLNVKPDYLPADWQWLYDPSVPTNRKLAAPFEKGKTFVTLIDFYLASPNIEPLEVKGVNIDFKYSDHQPVFLKAKLK